MNISLKDWIRFTGKLSKLSDDAADKMREYLAKGGGYANMDPLQVIGYATALAQKYGEGSATLAAMMYDAIAELSEKALPPAEVADTTDYSEMAKAINGAAKHTLNDEYLSSIVGRFVKRAGADTTLKNAIRDGAEFAWIPRGDTCPFCLTLASRGWQKISSKTLKDGHAEHIHSNCDCTYAVRFDSNTNYAGYDPDRYLEMYENADGGTSDEKINAMRRMRYAQNKDAINTQKRAAYHERKQRAHRGRGYDVLKEYFEDAEPGKGLFDFDVNYDKANRTNEIRTARLIHRVFGGNMLLKSEKPGQKNPDYEWMGRLWDLKSTTTEKSANSAIKSGMKQIVSNPGGIILNFEENDISMDELKKVIDLRMQWYPDESADILIISNGKPLSVLRY